MKCNNCGETVLSQDMHISGGQDEHYICNDSVAQLGEMLRKLGARATFDPGRNITHPCVICGEAEKPRDLVKIGVYTRRMGGNLMPGDVITRPMCKRCEDLTNDDKP